jgi:hypothetical protein
MNKNTLRDLFNIKEPYERYETMVEYGAFFLNSKSRRKVSEFADMIIDVCALGIEIPKPRIAESEPGDMISSTDDFLAICVNAIQDGKATFFREVWFSGTKKVSASHPEAKRYLAFHHVRFHQEIETYAKAKKLKIASNLILRSLFEKQEYYLKTHHINAKKWNSWVWVMDPQLMPNPEFWTSLCSSSE